MSTASEPNALPGLEPTLPSSWYLRDKYYALEREHIFMREWICAGREEELPAPGDHKVLDLYGESILLLRNEQSELKAFYNVCRHRGARICPAAPGMNNAKLSVTAWWKSSGNTRRMCRQRLWAGM